MRAAKPIVRLDLVHDRVHGDLQIRQWDALGDIGPGVHELYAEPVEGVTDSDRLVFMLTSHRKVVCQRLPHDNFEVYVEEGFMGDKRYPGTPYSGEWGKGSPEALEIQRQAIDVAMRSIHDQRGCEND